MHKEFVKIAREVIKFVKNGNKLQQKKIFVENKSACPLGAFAFNNNLSIDSFNIYDQLSKKLNWSRVEIQKFWFIFDNPFYRNNYEDLHSQIAFSIYKGALKRNWIIDLEDLEDN